MNCDILQIVCDKLDSLSQVRFCQISCLTLCNCDVKSLELRADRLTADTLQLYPRVRCLDLSLASIKDLNRLYLLEVLDISFTSVCNEDIKELHNLRDLCVIANDYITDLNHLTKLEVLFLHSDSIRDSGIRGLCNLRDLHIARNKTITDISHMTKLERLNADNTILTDAGIRGLCFMKNLRIAGNKQITYLNHMRRLHTLDARDTRLNDNSICDLCEMGVLKIRNTGITNISHMKRLRDLSACGPSTQLTDAGVAGLCDIRRLDISFNTQITDLNHMKELRRLDARYTMLTDNSIRELRNLCDVRSMHSDITYRPELNIQRNKLIPYLLHKSNEETE